MAKIANSSFVEKTHAVPFSLECWHVDLYSLQKPPRGLFWDEGCFPRWFLGVRSIRSFTKNMSDLYYDPCVYVYQI